MFKSVAALVFGAASVLAADVPTFSANDDYDEINLNIRLLEAHKNKTTIVKLTVPIAVSCPASFSSCTADYFGSSTTFTDGCCANIKTAASLDDTTACAVTSVTESASRRGRQLQTTLNLDVAAELTFTGTGASAAAQAFETAAAADSFTSAMTTAMTSVLTAIDSGLSATVSAPTVSVETTGGSTTTTTTAAPDTTTGTDATTAAPAADSSDASMMKANVALAAMAALIASIFA